MAKQMGRAANPSKIMLVSVAKFVDVSGLSRAVFVGHAMGGAIALALAYDYPDRVAGIGLISTGACLPIPSSVIENAANQSTLLLAIKSLQEMSSGSQTSANLNEINFKRLAETRQPLLLGDLLACDRFNMVVVWVPSGAPPWLFVAPKINLPPSAFPRPSPARSRAQLYRQWKGPVICSSWSNRVAWPN